MNNSKTSDEKTDQTPEFPFTESQDSKFYRNFLKRWEEYYPDSAERRVEEEEEREGEETKTETETEEKPKTEKNPKPEVRTEKETVTTGTDQPKKIFDYKSKKYVEQNWICRNMTIYDIDISIRWCFSYDKDVEVVSWCNNLFLVVVIWFHWARDKLSSDDSTDGYNANKTVGGMGVESSRLYVYLYLMGGCEIDVLLSGDLTGPG